MGSVPRQDHALAAARDPGRRRDGRPLILVEEVPHIGRSRWFHGWPFDDRVWLQTRRLVVLNLVVEADRQGGEDGQDGDAPNDGPDEVGGDGTALGEGPHGVGGPGDGLDVGEGLQPAGHALGRGEDRAGEHQREDGQEAGELRGFRVGDGEPDEGEHPGQGVAEQQGDDDGGHGGQEAVVETEADGRADDDHQQDHEDVADQVGDGSSGQDGRAGHGQGPEPVDDAFAHVLGQADRGGGGAEHDRLHDDARDQVVHVADPRDVDGAAEDVAEQQHEHDRLDGGEDQQLGGAGDAGQVTAGDDHGVGEDGRAREPDGLDRGQPLRLRWRQGGAGRDGGHAALRAGRGVRGVVVSGAARSSSPVLRPVSDRNTSSSEGRRSPRSTGTIPAVSRRRRAAIRSRTGSQTGMVICAWAWSMAGGPQPMPRSAAVAWSSSAAGTSTAIRSLPSRALSSSEVPEAITWPRSMTTLWSASWSASSRYWVVSSTVVPPATRSRMKDHMSSRVRGSSPVVGSSRIRTRGRPTRLRTVSGSFCTSTPLIRARPVSGASRVAKIRTRVVLPAPFGPSRPCTVPAGTLMSTPASALVSPKDLLMPSTSIMAPRPGELVVVIVM